MRDLYDSDSEFKEYVDRYAEKHGISVEKALTHLIVKIVAKETFNV